MTQEPVFEQEFEIKGGDFVGAGEASCRVRRILKEIGIAPDIIRRVAIASYEAEMNVVMYARRGTMRLSVDPGKVCLEIADEGPGIPDIDLAMQPGYSTATAEMREMGFGAGMGLPNIRKNADRFDIQTTVGSGTRLEIRIGLNDRKA